MPRIDTLEAGGFNTEATYKTVVSDDLLFIPECFQRLLVERKLVYLTKFNLKDGQEAAGTVVASSKEQAVTVAEDRGLGEEVVGVLYGYGGSCE
jgi:hypothetical protein